MTKFKNRTRRTRKNMVDRKDLRKTGADQRQVEADKRSPEEQIAHLDKFGFSAIKERAKLLKRIEKREEQKVEKKTKKKKED